MTVTWSSAARRDLLDILEYVAVENPEAAFALVARIEKDVAVLETHPAIGRPGRTSGTRELVVTDTSYIVPYAIAGSHIRILRIWHTARQWPDRF